MIANLYRKFLWDLSAATPGFKGKYRAVGLLSRPNNDNKVAIQREGVSWLVRGRDLNEFKIAAYRQHSTDIVEAIERYLPKNGPSVIWDIGANIGGVSLPLLQRNRQITSIMFEPSAEVAGRLIANALQNGDLLSRAQIVNVALSETTGLIPFFVSSEAINSGVGGLGKSHNRIDMPVHVQSYTGDSLIEAGAYHAPDVIKIDVEGFELEVLRGMRKTISERFPPVIFEHSLYRFEENKRSPDEVVSYLRSLGYEVYRMSDDARVTDADLNQNTDFVARKAG